MSAVVCFFRSSHPYTVQTGYDHCDSAKANKSSNTNVNPSIQVLIDIVFVTGCVISEAQNLMGVNIGVHTLLMFPNNQQ